MLSSRFIPSPQSVVRSPQFLFYTDRRIRENPAKILSADWICLTGSEKNQSIISNGDFFFSHNDFSLSTVNMDLT